MGKVFAVLAVILMVGCADVGETEVEDADAISARARADAGKSEPVLELPAADAGAALIPADKTGSDAALPVVAEPVADAAVAPVAPVSPVAPVAPVVEPVPAPVVEEPGQLTFFDGVVVRFMNTESSYEERLVFHVAADAKSATVERHALDGTRLEDGVAFQLSPNRWRVSLGPLKCETAIDESREYFPWTTCLRGFNATSGTWLFGLLQPN